MGTIIQGNPPSFPLRSTTWDTSGDYNGGKFSQGANVESPAKNAPDTEGDADIIATFESLKLIVYVQAKFHRGKTDSHAVKQIRQYADNISGSDEDEEFARLFWVISTAEGFTEECKSLAKHKKVRKKTRLIDGNEFAKMLLDTGIEGLQEL